MKLTQFIAVLACFAMASCSSSKKETKVVEVEETEGLPKKDAKTILFFGNSITAGYQLDMSEAFPALLQERLDSLKLDYTTVNAGLSGETTASGNSRVEWVLKNPVDIFVLELGANDGLRGISTVETEKNLQLIIDKVKGLYPECQIVLAGMMIPPNMGQDYTTKFQEIYPRLAATNGIPLIPFLLANVAGIPELNLDDGIHPTAEGHKILAENVWSVLSLLL
ncbi:MAG: arylesterase [Reichenbachiella sp.]